MPKLNDFDALATTVLTDPARRANVERHRQEAVAEIVAYKLAELRKLRSITQTELARTLGVAQPSISNVEHGGDALISTLRSYVEALGGRLEVAAVFDGDRVPLDV